MTKPPVGLLDFEAIHKLRLSASYVSLLHTVNASPLWFQAILTYRHHPMSSHVEMGLLGGCLGNELLFGVLNE